MVVKRGDRYLVWKGVINGRGDPRPFIIYLERLVSTGLPRTPVRSSKNF